MRVAFNDYPVREYTLSRVEIANILYPEDDDIVWTAWRHVDAGKAAGRD